MLSCGTAGNTNTPATPTTTPTVTPTTPPTQVVLSASPTSVKSDSSVSSTITATVLDAGNAAVANANVQFSTTAGLLSGGVVTTGVNGQASVQFSAGPNRSNQIATITATLLGTVPAITGQIPVQITGSTVSLTSTSTNISSTIQDTLAVTANDFGGNGINNTPVVITQTGTGSVAITQSSPNTDVNGQVTATITGVTSGNVTLTVSAAGATKTQSYAVTITGAVFAITSPVTDPYSLSAGVVLPITVSVPTGVTNVTFATSLGQWNGLTAVQSVAVVGGVATANFTSTQAGVASIQVFDTAASVTSDSMTIAISQPAANAAKVTVQTNTTVVAASQGGVSNTATLTATVTDGGLPSGQPVGGANVAFAIANPTGSGETVSPVVVTTDSAGKAVTTFTSGSSSTGALGVDVYAYVLPHPIGNPVLDPYTDSVNIVVGGTAGSVALGRATVVQVKSLTEYALPMSVIVADSNGNPVPGNVVTLKVWPSFYSFGRWFGDSAGSNCKAIPFLVVAPLAAMQTDPFIVPNEDLNRNLTLNTVPTSEDQTLGVQRVLAVDTYGNPSAFGATIVVNDGMLTPGNSHGGTAPGSVTTDVNGVANFNLTYLKGDGAWVIDEIIATTQVLGTETTSKLEFRLPVAKSDAGACTLPDSPFNGPTL